MGECSNDTVPVFNEQNMLFWRYPGKTQPDPSMMVMIVALLDVWDGAGVVDGGSL